MGEAAVTAVGDTGRAGADMGADIAKMPEADLKALANKLADQIVVQIKSSDIAETSVQIKNIPLFDGASVTVKEFQTAQGEFNISFENLSNQAKALMDMGVNQEALKAALDAKGIPVHIITTTTDPAQRTLTAETREGREGSARRDPGDQQDNPKRDKG